MLILMIRGRPEIEFVPLVQYPLLVTKLVTPLRRALHAFELSVTGSFANRFHSGQLRFLS